MNFNVNTLTIIGTLVAVAGLGFGAGTTLSAGKKEQLEERATQCDTQRQEQKTLLENLQKREQELTGELIRAQTHTPAFPAQTSGEDNSSGSAGPKITILVGDTGEIQGQLSISVTAIAPTPVGEPLQYLVTATFGAPGAAAKLVPSMKVGDRVAYGGYEILLLQADLTRAKFAISTVSATGKS